MNSDVPETLLAAATEYGMLHLGGGRFRAKAFEAEAERDDEREREEDRGARGEGEGEGEGEGLGSSSDSGSDSDSGSGSGSDSDPGSDDSGGSADAPSPASAGKKKRRRVAPASPPATGPRVFEHASVAARPPWEGRVARAEGARAAAEGSLAASEGSLAASEGSLAASSVSDAFPWFGDVDASDRRAVGRWGEALVYHHLVRTRPGWRVTWVNEREETNAFYDIRMDWVPDGADDPGGVARTIFAEVKTTRFADKNAFEVSPWEWDFAQRPGVDFRIYRVYSAGDRENVRVRVVKNPAKLVREKAVSLCLAV
jgi:hypothetical protein